ncbi:hypothetical protein [Roseomonas sp. WA12]
MHQFSSIYLAIAISTATSVGALAQPRNNPAPQSTPAMVPLNMIPVNDTPQALIQKGAEVLGYSTTFVLNALATTMMLKSGSDVFVCTMLFADRNNNTVGCAKLV